MTTLSAQIRGARGLLGWSQSDLAQRAGVSLPTLNRIERGAIAPRYTTVERLMSAFSIVGVSLHGDPHDGGVIIRFDPSVAQGAHARRADA